MRAADGLIHLFLHLRRMNHDIPFEEHMVNWKTDPGAEPVWMHPGRFDRGTDVNSPASAIRKAATLHLAASRSPARITVSGKVRRTEATSSIC
jgi:hypothetical protein